MSGHRARLVWLAIAAAVAVVVVVVIVVTNKPDQATSGPASSTNSPSLPDTPETVAVGADSLPPWPAPADATAAARNAGLPMLSSEGMVEHIHVHLDVIADGQPVPVPANIGIDRVRRGISPLHTHDATGVIHIESPVKRQFSLGEFFSEWGVSLSADNIGGLRADDAKTVRAYVNGRLHPGDPAAIMFNQHDEVALIYGSPNPGEPVPSTYQFPAGD
jgi:hypothetical protein